MSAITREVQGLASRRIAADLVEGVVRKGRSLDEQLEAANLELSQLDERDRGLVRMIAATTIRRLGTLKHLICDLVRRGLPSEAPRAESALLIGAAQILWLDVPDHAAVDLSVRLVQENRYAARYGGLVNAVLRRVTREGKDRVAALDPVALDTPDWLLARWTRRYGADTGRAIAASHAHEPPFDLTVASDPAGWAARLGGRVILNSTIRLQSQGAVAKLPGYAEGAWWVQDAAATLPARLLGEVRGLRVADLCAAPGGKTAQLASAGAHVTAVDRSANRLARLAENLKRLNLTAEIVTADATAWSAAAFDAVLLDAPCSSTGTIRRHPDVPWLKREQDVLTLAALQTRLLDHAVTLVKPGGVLVYCTCSLEPEEGEAQIAALLAREPQLKRLPIAPSEVADHAEFITAEGDLRTLPCYLPAPDSRMAGLDGFYAARLQRVNV